MLPFLSFPCNVVVVRQERLRRTVTSKHPKCSRDKVGPGEEREFPDKKAEDFKHRKA